MMTKKILDIPAVCPRDCPDTCSIKVTLEGEKLVKITGNKEHPVTMGFLCNKAYRYPERLYSKNRLKKPLLRNGQKGNREAFKEIEWDKAIKIITKNLEDTIEQWGSEAILPYSYKGTMGMLNSEGMDQRFFNKLGASKLERTICSDAGKIGYKDVMGDLQGIDPLKTKNVDLMILWGANSATTNIHQMAIAKKVSKKGGKVISIDIYENLTAKKTDHFIKINPGTDGALALAIMNIIIAENLHDEIFINSYTYGFQQLKERVKEYPPEKVAHITGINESTIKWLAKEYARTPNSFIMIGNGLQHYYNGDMTVRNITCLPALTGAWKYNGGGALRSNGGYFKLNHSKLHREDLRPKDTRVINMNQIGRALVELENPPIKSLIVYNANPMAAAPRGELLRAGLKREDLFTVVIEQFMTDTAKYADIVLPATTFFEHTDLYKSYWHLHLQYSEAKISPLHECKSNFKIFQELALKLGFKESCFFQSEDEVVKDILDTDHLYLKNITFEKLTKEGSVKLNVKGDIFEDTGDVLPTPTGKIKFYSKTREDEGLDPLPDYYDDTDTDAECDLNLNKSKMFRLVTPPSHHFLNSTFNEIDIQREKAKRPTVKIHPDDAKELGIVSEQLIRLVNVRGKVNIEAEIDEATSPGVLIGESIWWPTYSPDGKNLNEITPDGLSARGNGAIFFSNFVEIEI